MLAAAGKMVINFPVRKKNKAIKTLIMNATIWFSVSDETNIPIPT